MRAIVIVLDSVGIGALPDAADYGDAGANTLAHIADAAGGLGLPNLAALGLGNISPIRGVGPVERPAGCYGKMAEVSRGKDTTTGHWEMMGVISERPFPVYPDGFPRELIAEFERRIGTRILGNRAASGTEIIKELGEEHVRTGFPIVYTSADSVLQIAAHEDVIPVDRLYQICRAARELLVYPNDVQRVIARPFIGAAGSYVRTENRRDFALEPPSDTLLDLLVRQGREVIGIGKIEDIFAHRGISRSNHTGNNADSIAATIAEIHGGRGTLIFTNLVDFDMLYGHRNDPAGEAAALREFDDAIPAILGAMRDGDLLIVTADHGCDPTIPGTDHSREYVFLLVYGKQLRQGVDLGIRQTFSDIACTLAELFGIEHTFAGSSFAAGLTG